MREYLEDGSIVGRSIFYRWMGGNFSTFSSGYFSMIVLLISDFCYFSSPWGLLITLFPKWEDLYLSGDKPSAHFTAPLTPFLTLSEMITGSIGGISTLEGETSYFTSITSFYFSIFNRSSYLFCNTLPYCCKYRSKPLPGWIQGRYFFTIYLASS